MEVNLPTLTPPLESDPKYGRDFEDYASETHEWLSMALLESPRLSSRDKIDSFLSRYAPPGETMQSSVVSVTWQGFMSPTWTYKSFVDILLSIPNDEWFAYSITGFPDRWEAGGRHSMILKLPDSPSDYVLWDVS